ncbi:hypothetical protein P171DRAFT_480939 [Karstenula rhodostoma CBS 690.94]|uniref:Uncharacterized protein n=1 Tax=Karstenula rhodostoma CBS 690.94 TaxID=1392251 RepID=A0A9P4PT19_9PLEO|nr:hypothetical protein P171DRAFT_480939 [Karstenula rhodostoma CBS 690.94]
MAFPWHLGPREHSHCFRQLFDPLAALDRKPSVCARLQSHLVWHKGDRVTNRILVLLPLYSGRRNCVCPDVPQAFVSGHAYCGISTTQQPPLPHALLQHDTSLEQLQDLTQGSATIMPLPATTATQSSGTSAPHNDGRSLQTATCVSASPIHMHPICAVYAVAPYSHFAQASRH